MYRVRDPGNGGGGCTHTTDAFLLEPVLVGMWSLVDGLCTQYAIGGRTNPRPQTGATSEEAFLSYRPQTLPGSNKKRRRK